jgi:8-oxo-dGTP diphosphatase
VLVHRPAYDDWSLPKGKTEPMEDDEDAALREVMEETGLSCELGQELPSVTYLDRRGRRKTVRYWAMTVTPAAAATDRLEPAPKGRGEVDELCWVPLDLARHQMTYARDSLVLGALEDLLGSDVRGQEADDALEGKPERDEAG